MTIQSAVKNANSVGEKMIDEKMSDLSMAEAIAQFKEATSSIYDAMGLIGNATAASAKVRVNEGKARAVDLEEKAEEAVRSHPLVTVGIAFAAGCLASHLLGRR